MTSPPPPFTERLSRRNAQPPFISGLLLDVATVEKHQSTHGFGSGANPKTLSSPEASPPRPYRQQSAVIRSTLSIQ
jgi:hypothetical protein